MGAVATAAALALTVFLFRVIGAKRTRLVAQVVAAVIGAAFVIGLQIAAIFSAGSLSRFAALQSDWMLAHAPDTRSAFWWPAHAVLGDYSALAAVVTLGIAVLAASIALFSRNLGNTPRRRQGSPARPCVIAVGRCAFAGARRPACCGIRSGRCSCAIRG